MTTIYNAALSAATTVFVLVGILLGMDVGDE